MIAFVLVAMTFLAKVVLAVTIGIVGYRILWPGAKMLWRGVKQTVSKIVGVFRKKKKTPDEEAEEIYQKRLERARRLPRYKHWEEFTKDLRDPGVEVEDILIKCGGKLPKELPSLEVIEARKNARTFLAERNISIGSISWRRRIGTKEATPITIRTTAREVTTQDFAKLREHMQHEVLSALAVPEALLDSKPSSKYKVGDWVRLHCDRMLYRLSHPKPVEDSDVHGNAWNLKGSDVGVIWDHEANFSPALPRPGEWWDWKQCTVHHKGPGILKVAYENHKKHSLWVKCGCIVPVNFGKGTEQSPDPIDTPTTVVKDTTPKSVSAKLKSGKWVRLNYGSRKGQLVRLLSPWSGDGWHWTDEHQFKGQDYPKSFEPVEPRKGEWWQWVKCDEGCSKNGGCSIVPLEPQSSHVSYSRLAAEQGHYEPVNFGKGKVTADAV